MNKIPVFLHIPKNAGTYVLGVTMSLFRHYGISKGWRNKPNWNLNLRRILLQKEGVQIATVFVYDPEEVRKTNKNFKSHHMDEYCNTVDIDHFKDELKNKKIVLFSIIVESEGVKYIKDKLYDTICDVYNCSAYYYTILRNPFDRAVSMYHYISGGKSTHEPTHGMIKSDKLETYLKSYQLEDSWLIRNLNNIDESQVITHKDFTDACFILNKFNIIVDISKTDELLTDVFLKCYEIDQSITQLNSNEINKNATSQKNNILFEELDEVTKNIFLVRTELDRNIYNKYCMNYGQNRHN
jgi:hypothetical protein